MTLIIRLIILLCLMLSGYSSAQEYNRSAVKAELTVRLINHIIWKNENQSENFHIAFYGEETDYLNYLQTSTGNRTVRGKKIQLSVIDSLDQLSNYHILVVAEKTKLPFSEIALKARHSNTLLVSEGITEQIYIMINFLQSADHTLSFELNRANILLEQLTISKDILLLGGTELDVARLYREMEKNLSSLIDKLNITQQQSELANSALQQKQEKLDAAQSSLAKTQKSLKAVNTTLENQRSIVKSAQNELDIVTASANENQRLLTKQNELLNLRSQMIQQQQKKVEDNETLLRSQQHELVLQKSNIEAQISTIQDQEQLLYITLAVITLFLVLLFWLYRINQDRKRISLELAHRGIMLEEEVKERTARATESEMHYRTLAELSPVGVYQTDVEGYCHYVNERWCEYSGLSRQQAMGLGWIEAIHPKDKSNLTEHWNRHLDSEKLLNSEFRYLRSDGNIRWLLGQCTAEYNVDGELQGYIGAITDITDQKKLEEQLRRTQKMDAMGKLTGGIAHDYNNMLAVISGYGELLQIKLTEKPELLNYVEHIVRASKRGTELTKKLLDFSKRAPSDAKCIDINQLIQNQKQMIEKILTPRICLTLQLQEQLWPVLMDEGDLEDALLNICINSMHAMEESGTLTIETKNLPITEIDTHNPLIRSEDYVLITITDTGIGMDEETKEKLFDPFFSTKGTKGTGLGLTQVYSFVERSKGSIIVDSTPNKGTQFRIYFPTSKQAEQKVIQVSKKPVVTHRASETILIVDDEAALLELVQEILQREGYKTICAIEASEALKVLQHTSVDLLLSDVIMPGMNGYQLANVVREKYPTVKIQLVSGYTDKKELQSVDESLTKNLLYKPFDSQLLLTRIRELLIA